MGWLDWAASLAIDRVLGAKQIIDLFPDVL